MYQAPDFSSTPRLTPISSTSPSREIEARIREKAGVAAPQKAAEDKAEDKKVEQLPARKRG